MKERPIIFSGPMVKAILDGKKTMTRRVVNPQPPEWCIEFGYTCFTPKGKISGRGIYQDEGPAEKFFKCPYGVPGDRLWVRETFQCRGDNPQITPDDYIYRADGEKLPHEWMRWYPSIHMPHWASRILLEIKAVRVERLQDITPHDAHCEGWPGMEVCGLYPQTWFEHLWRSINGKKHTWADNPWVWVIEFERVKP